MAYNKLRIKISEIQDMQRLGKVKELIKILKDRIPDIRARAAMALGYIGDVRVIKPLIRTLKDKEWSVRKAAAGALGYKRDPKVVEPLCNTLKDEKESVREVAAIALGKIGDARAVEPLVQALNDQNWAVRSAATRALGNIGDDRATIPLCNIIKDETETVREEVVKVLSKMKDTRAIEPLVQTLKNQNRAVRSAAAKALGNFGDMRAVEPLIQALKDQTSVAREAVESLGNLGDPRATEPLIQTLNSDTTVSKERIVQALIKIGDLRAADTIINYLFTFAGPVDLKEFNSWFEALQNIFGDYTALILKASKIISRNTTKLTMFRDGEEFNYNVRQSTEAVDQLCNISTPISSNILYKILQKKDISVLLRWYCDFSDDSTLNFESQRYMARKELNRRGDPPYDPSVYLNKSAWKL